LTLTTLLTHRHPDLHLTPTPPHPPPRTPHPTPHLLLCPQSGKELRKIADRDRKASEKAAQAKAAALRDDDNVFDVSYEQQGEGDGTLSATDIKVGGWVGCGGAELLVGWGGRGQWWCCGAGGGG
jgi:hypothetical protein